MDISEKATALRSANPFNLLDPEEQERLAEKVTVKSLARGETLFRAGDPGDAFYVIVSGFARVLEINAAGQDVPVNTLSKGDTFGEIALLKDSPRTATIRAIEDLVLLRLDREDFQRLLQQNQEIRSFLDRSLNSFAIRDFIKQFTVLDAVPAKVLRSLVGNLEVVAIKPGETVIRQGQASDRFYMIKSGTLRVLKSEAGAEKEVGRLSPGGYFGELGLESGSLRAASVIAETPCELFALSKNGFETVLQIAPELRQRLQFAASSYYEEHPSASTPAAAGKTAAAAAPAAEEYVVDRGWRRLLQRPGRAAVQGAPRPWRQRYFKQYPFIAQNDMSDCGAACLSMIIKYHGSFVPLSRLRDSSNVDRDGASLWSLAQGASAMGFEVRGLQINKDAVTAVATPAIVHWEGVQYLVLYEATDEQVVVGDPGVGIRKIPTEEFKRGFTGRVLELSPSASFVKAGSAPSPYMRLQAVLGKRKAAIGWVVLFSILINVCALAFPLFTGVILDKVLRSEGLVNFAALSNPMDKVRFLNLCFLAMLFITVVQGATTALRQFFVIQLSNKTDHDLLDDFLRHIMRLPLRFFDLRRVGDVTTRLSENDNIRQAMVGTIPGIFLDTIMAVGSTAYLISLDWKLTLVVLATIPVFLALMLGFAPVIRRNRRKYFAKKTDQSAYLIESMSGISTVKMMGIESLVSRRWKGLYLEALELGSKGARIGAIHSALATFLMMVSAPLFLWVGVLQTLKGVLTLGQLMTFLGITGNIINPILRLVVSWQTFQEVRNSAERLNDIFDAEPEQSLAGGKPLLEPSRLRGHIKFENLTFKYTAGQDIPTLSNLSFEIKAGQTVAVVGRSGSGKSTLAKLILGLYLPTEGRVLVDGNDTQGISGHSLRSRVGVVPQEVFLFSGTVRENVALGIENPPFDKIVAACRLANAHDFICNLCLGYETKVGERGVGLSGGQRQRVALARALYREPDILLLDEATSALDAESERAVQHSLDTAMKDKTRIVIAHRLSTVQNADWTLVLDKGSIAEQGTHDDLLKLNGLYASLVKQQLSL